MTDAGIPQHHQYDFSKGLPGTVEQQILATLERIESLLTQLVSYSGAGAIAQGADAPPPANKPATRDEQVAALAAKAAPATGAKKWRK